MNQIQSWRLRLKGSSSAHETKKILKIINEGLISGEFKVENWNIDPIKVTQNLKCKNLKSCYDTCRSLSVSKLMLLTQKDLFSQ